MITGTQGAPIQVIDVASARILRQSEMLLSDFGLAFAINPTARLIAMVDLEDNIHLLDIDSLQPLAMISVHHDYVIGLAFNKDGSKLASASKDGAILLWDTKSRSHPQILKAIGAMELQYIMPPSHFWNTGMYTQYLHWAPALVFSPESKWIIAGALDGLGRAWLLDANSGTPFAPIDRGGAFTPDGNRFATLDRTSIIRTFTYSPAENQSEGDLGNSVEIARHSGPIRSLTISSDAKTIFTSDLRCFHSWSRHSLSVWQQNEIIANSSSFDTFYPASDSDPSRIKLVAGGIDGNISIWGGEAGQFEQLFTAHPDPMGLNGAANVEEILFSPDGRLLASIGVNGDVKVWDTQHFQRVSGSFMWQAHSLAFDISGEMLAFSGQDFDREDNNRSAPSVRIINTETGAIIAQTFRDASVIAISPEKNAIGTGNPDGGMDLLSIPKFKLLAQLKYNNAIPTSAIFLHTTRYIAIGTKDGFIQLWDTNLEHLIASVKAHSGSVNVLKLTPDNHTLLSGGEDGVVKIWNLGN